MCVLKLFICAMINVILTSKSDYAGWIGKFAGQSFPATDGFFKVVRNEPLGVVAGYEPFSLSALKMSRNRLNTEQYHSLEWSTGIYRSQSRACIGHWECFHPQAKRKDPIGCCRTREACDRGWLSSWCVPGLDRRRQYRCDTRQSYENCESEFHWKCANRQKCPSPCCKE